MSTDTECIQVVIVPPLRPHLERWLAANGLTLAQMPIDNPDDLPTYGVMPLPSAGEIKTSNEEDHRA